MSPIAALFRQQWRTDFDGISEGERPLATLDRDARFRRSLAMADATAVAVALGLAVVLGGDRLEAGAILLVPLIIVLGKLAGIYDRDANLISKSTLDEAPQVFNVASVWILIAWIFQEAFLSGDVGGLSVAVLWLALMVAMVVARAVARRIVLTRTTPERCLVLGDAVTALALRERLAASRVTGADVVGWVPLDGGRHRAGATAEIAGAPPRLGTLPGLAAVLWSEQIDRVVISVSSPHADERLLDKIRLVKSVGIKVSLLPRLLEVVGSSVEFDDVEGLPLLGVRGYGLTRSSQLLKRGLDVAASGTGLVLLSPLILVVALVIKVDSRGPVFFRQRRIGRCGEPFHLLKFRTMRDGADDEKDGLLDRNEADGLFKIADDPRITRAGRVLRRYSLDELPQLVNVLRGEMSLVGPRPLVPEEDGRVEGWLRRRLDMSPGMTGVWQVLGSSRVPLHRMVKVDYLYRANWSLWLDLKILLRTVPYVLGRRGL